jgi:beta-galactosidase
MWNRVACLIALLLVATGASARNVRHVEDFDSDWRFHLGDASGAEGSLYADSTWNKVNVPHDWSIAGPIAQSNTTGPAGGFFPNGIGWYRKHFAVSKDEMDRRVYVVFDGVMANSDVWINGFHLGHRPNGYVSFYYDLTEHLRPGRDNVLAVRCDNAQQPASRWYEGAGIYRHVRLVSMATIHLSPWSATARVSDPLSSHPFVQVTAEIENHTEKVVASKLSVSVTGPSGHIVARGFSEQQPLQPGGRVKATVTIPITNPQRWDLAHPAMYRANLSLSGDKLLLDDDQIAFGIRDATFDAERGFLLNGHSVKIRGVALHIDGGAVGTAVPAAVYEARLRTLKSLGVNAIRTAHNPPSPEFLELCDRLGMLVMDEMFDAWTVGKEPYDYHLVFNEWAIPDERDTVRRDRNHPSIVLWSAGNEIHDTPKPEIAKKILASLVATFHDEDPTRPVTQALFRPNASHDYEDGLADMLDVVGQNYRESEILAAHAQKLTRKIIGTENTHDRAVWLALRDNMPYAGQFLWSGVDYLGEAGEWPLIANASGLLDRDEIPRARAFERESWWSETPSVHITRRVMPDEKAAVDPGYESIPPKFLQSLFLDWSPQNRRAHTETVEVYSNCDEVELLLNGASLGRKPLLEDASPRVWQVQFASGRIDAVAYKEGRRVATDKLETADAATQITLNSRSSDAKDIFMVDAQVVDNAGTRVPSAANLLHFSVSGPGTILAVDNGSLVDHSSFGGPDRRAFQGRALLIIRPTKGSGRITITATSPGLRNGTVTLEVVPTSSNVKRSF